MRNATSLLPRRSFLGRIGGMLAGLVAGVPLIHRSMRDAGEVSAAPTPANAGRIRARIHPMAVARKTSRSLPNV